MFGAVQHMDHISVAMFYDFFSYPSYPQEKNQNITCFSFLVDTYASLR